MLELAFVEVAAVFFAVLPNFNALTLEVSTGEEAHADPAVVEE